MTDVGHYLSNGGDEIIAPIERRGTSKDHKPTFKFCQVGACLARTRFVARYYKIGICLARTRNVLGGNFNGNHTMNISPDVERCSDF